MKKIIISILVIALLVILFYPKECGYYNRSWGLVEKQCLCLGKSYDCSWEGCTDCGTQTCCIGFCIDCRCFKGGEINGKIVNRTETRCG